MADRTSGSQTLAEEWIRKILTVLHLARQQEAKGARLPPALDLFVKVSAKFSWHAVQWRLTQRVAPMSLLDDRWWKCTRWDLRVGSRGWRSAASLATAMAFKWRSLLVI